MTGAEVWLVVSGRNVEQWSCCEEFASEAEALAGAAAALDLSDGEAFSVGRKVQPAAPRIDTDRILRHMSEAAYDAHGEPAEDWLDDVTREQEKELEDELEAVVTAWLTRNNLEPDYFIVEDVSEHVHECAESEGINLGGGS